MASIEEFLELLGTNFEKAMKDYVFNVDAASLDGDISTVQDCTERTVGFEFKDPNVILMRAGREGDAWHSDIWYLPWVHRGAAKAVLTGAGPAFFSTSQLDGCRFMVEYEGANRKKATVLHLAGNVGANKAGSSLRDTMARWPPDRAP